MKKYLILAAATITAVLLMVGIRVYTTPQTIPVQLVTVEASSVRQTVECNGKVQTAGSSDVFVEMPCIARDIYVREGQQVNKGDALFSVDVEATQQVLAQLGGGNYNVTTQDIKNTVTAPVSGVVTSLNVRSGAVTDSAKPCAVISSDNKVNIAVTVREKHISQIAVGQPVEISGVAFNKEVYHGTVTQISTVAHQEYIGSVSETVVDAVVSLSKEEIDDSLRVGLNARATVVVDVLEDALLVPYTCIAQDEEGTEYVYVYRDNDTVVRQVPTFGKECGDGVLVVSGLAAGERLVQDPESLSGDTVSVQVE